MIQTKKCSESRCDGCPGWPCNQVQKGDPRILIRNDDMIHFHGEIGECPRCHNVWQDLVFIKHVNDDYTDQGGLDLSWDVYRCPKCNAAITFGVSTGLGLCFWEVSYP
jgi:hypothetical protein